MSNQWRSVGLVEYLAGCLQETGSGGLVVAAMFHGPGNEACVNGVTRKFIGSEVEVDRDAIAGRWLDRGTETHSQMLRLNQFPVGDDGGVFKTVAQFPDVAGPVIGA